MGEPRNHAPWCSFEHEGSCPAENEMPRLRAELREPDLAAELARVSEELKRVRESLDAKERQFTNAANLLDRRTDELDALREFAKREGFLPDDLPNPSSFDRGLRERLGQSDAIGRADRERAARKKAEAERDEMAASSRHGWQIAEEQERRAEQAESRLEQLRAGVQRIIDIGSAPLSTMRSANSQMRQRGQAMLDEAKVLEAALLGRGGE